MFAVNSVLFGSWFSRIPEIQTRLGLSEGELGLALLGMPLGSLAIMPLVGWLIARYGAGRTALGAAIVFCGAIAAPVFAWDRLSLTAAMVGLGLAHGSMNVSMNAEAAATEARLETSILSMCHACSSIGGMVGAIAGGAIAALGITPQSHLVSVASLMAILAIARGQSLLDSPPSQVSEPIFAWPSRPIVGLAAVAFCIWLGEGAMADWSTVYLRNTLHSTPLLAGASFACFSLGMAIGRLYCDCISERFGSALVVQIGTLVAAIGLIVGLSLENPYAGIVGFSFVGIGFAGVIPLLFRAAARTPGMAAGTNIAAVASVGYVGFLTGPPLIGFAAESMGLAHALGIVAGFSLLAHVMTGSPGVQLE
jgi:MFS family permease